MFVKKCFSCKGSSVNTLKSSNQWKTMHQFCSHCGKDQTKHVLGRKHARIYSKMAPKRIKKPKVGLYAYALLIWAVFAMLSIPAYALTSDEKWGQQQTLKEIIQKVLHIKSQAIALQPTAIGITHLALVTKYNSVPEQTDDTPFITASGTHVRDGIVANNCLKFGTRVIINDKAYEVHDRMNKRYGCQNYDIWSDSLSEARNFGAQRMEVTEIVEL